MCCALAIAPALSLGGCGHTGVRLLQDLGGRPEAILQVCSREAAIDGSLSSTFTGSELRERMLAGLKASIAATEKNTSDKAAERKRRQQENAKKKKEQGEGAAAQQSGGIAGWKSRVGDSDLANPRAPSAATLRSPHRGTKV